MNIVYQAAKKDEAHQHETSSDLQIYNVQNMS